MYIFTFNKTHYIRPHACVTPPLICLQVGRTRTEGGERIRRVGKFEVAPGRVSDGRVHRALLLVVERGQVFRKGRLYLLTCNVVKNTQLYTYNYNSFINLEKNI